MDDLLAAIPRGLVAAWAALVGATVGSFLNVVIARVPAGQSVVRPRSRCPRCGHQIAWYDNVPVLSWLLLRGRCRRCAVPISLRYPVVELLGGGLGWLAWHRHGFTPSALLEFAFTALLLALAAIDLDTWLLPNALTWPLLALGLACGALGLSAVPSFQSAAVGAGLGFGAFWLVSWLGRKAFKKEALGFGDVWLLSGLGAWLGGAALLPVVLLASSQGAVVGLILIAIGKAQPGPAGPVPAGTTRGRPASTSASDEDEDWVPPRYAVPFGPFLVAGALEWLWLGDRLRAAVPLLGVFR